MATILLHYWNFVMITKFHYIVRILICYQNSVQLPYFCYVSRTQLNYIMEILLCCWNSFTLLYRMSLHYSTMLHNSIALHYWKFFQNEKSCVCKDTRPSSLPANNSNIELEPISTLLPDTSDQVSLQIIQEILKASGVDFSKF